MSGSADGVFRADVAFIGSSNTYFNPASAFFQKLDSYANIDLRAGLRGKQWDATLFVKNLADKRAEVDKLFQTDSPLSVFTTRPRTYGLNVGYRF